MLHNACLARTNPFHEIQLKALSKRNREKGAEMDTWPFLEDASEEPKMDSLFENPFHSLFENPFHIEDIMVFDDPTLQPLAGK
ncbi:hypothetical protein KSC_104390 [Ktedonobacter sp. SOSP1-52]|uniref:hypothetical protein n=1 Tax=Ktedonobacter sp. SOSP1-52 TaxID=2778366 RepID=UPI001916275B|nr:hypothetical protein [Ktedonobacter sp. SOSP1-52]GHO71547.1 hypothetical protein KSC_104390 [Ktedonobacter sp. SOSP1-52]